MFKVKVRFLANLRFDEFYVTRRLSEICPDINIRDIHNTNQFSIIVLDSEAEGSKLLQPEIINALEPFHLKPVPSQAYSSSKAIFVTKLGQHVLRSSQDAILQDINTHNEHKARAVFVLQNRRLGIPSTLKVLYNDPQTVEYVVKRGIKIFDLAISPENIRREEHVELTQCYRCFSFCHNTKSCTSPVQKCSICAEYHHYKSCNRQRTRCALCDGPHQATFVRCPIRLLTIANRNEETARSASVSSHAPTTSAVNFPPLPPSHAHAPSYPQPVPPPPQTPSSSTHYASAVKTPPPIPPPRKSLYNNPPLNSKFVKLNSRPSTSSISRRDLQRYNPPPSSSSVRPRGQSTQPPQIVPPPPPPAPPANPVPSHPAPAQIQPPPPAPVQAPPPPPPPTPASTSYPPYGSALYTHGEYYYSFKVADRLADKLAGQDHYLYAKIMNNYLKQCNLPLLNIDEFFRIANVPIPSPSPPTPSPPTPIPEPSHPSTPTPIPSKPPPPSPTPRSQHPAAPRVSPPPRTPTDSPSPSTPSKPSSARPSTPPSTPPQPPKSFQHPRPMSPPPTTKSPSSPPPSKSSSVLASPRIPPPSPLPTFVTSSPSLPNSQASTSASPLPTPSVPLQTSPPTTPSVTSRSVVPTSSILSSPSYDFTPSFVANRQTPSLPLSPHEIPSSPATASPLPQRPQRVSRPRDETFAININPSPSPSIPPTVDLVTPSDPSQESEIYIPHNLPLHSPSQNESSASLNLHLSRSLSIDQSLNLRLSSSTPSSSQRPQAYPLTPIPESCPSINSSDSDISVDVEGSPSPPLSVDSAAIFITQPDPPPNRYPLRNKQGPSSCSSSRSSSPLTM